LTFPTQVLDAFRIRASQDLQRIRKKRCDIGHPLLQVRPQFAGGFQVVHCLLSRQRHVDVSHVLHCRTANHRQHPQITTVVHYYGNVVGKLAECGAGLPAHQK
jgi:hypothetical protein